MPSELLVIPVILGAKLVMLLVAALASLALLKMERLAFNHQIAGEGQVFQEEETKLIVLQAARLAISTIAKT
jgi:hypothetical protein